MSGTSSRTNSSGNAIQDIRNDPDVYMEIRPTRNSNACASCRKKKKRCEPGPQGPNTTCQRCSDYGLECKYEYAIGQQPDSPSPSVSASSPSPPPSHSLFQYNRRNPSARSGAGPSLPYRGDASANRSTTHNFLSPFNTSYLSPSHSGHLPPSTGRVDTSPLTNTHGALHQGNIYPNIGTNPFLSQGFTGPLATTATIPYLGSPSFAPQFGQQQVGNNSSGGLTHSYNGQGPMNFAQQTPSTTCGCTLESTCYLHRPPSAPTDTSDFGWTQNSYFQQ
ncbi:hypothetical protein PILCRDRAFT_811159 [Piloderma croceum F 1598]|uniref:Zn(2)-C6 fungal-type domain-containing protein n=1 Tax=Piloderma croceum (strain F 1598) TaxID=765440 RepID=A0A0C3GGA6_PILCF|nr:hypothetical protein PILCRDRAFT_811159 [Piloderma croceum F 1598]